MRTKEQNDKLINIVIRKAFKEFNKYPFDWTCNELEAQVRLYNIIEKSLKDTTNEAIGKVEAVNVVVQNEGKQRINPIPEYNHTICPLRLECGVIDKCGDKRYPDISIVNSQYSKYIEGKLKSSTDNESIDILDTVLDMFIEVKSAWGYCAGQFDGEGMVKDLRLMSMYKNKGYFVYFIGNQYGEIEEDIKQDYRSRLRMMKEQYNYDKNQVFIVFRDQIFNGMFENIIL